MASFNGRLMRLSLKAQCRGYIKRRKEMKLSSSHLVGCFEGAIRLMLLFPFDRRVKHNLSLLRLHTEY